MHVPMMPAPTTATRGCAGADEEYRAVMVATVSSLPLQFNINDRYALHFKKALHADRENDPVFLIAAMRFSCHSWPLLFISGKSAGGRRPWLRLDCGQSKDGTQCRPAHLPTR